MLVTSAKADWSYPRGDASASGVTKTQLPEQLDVAWEFRAGDAIESTPIVSGDRVFVADASGTLYALGREKGEEIWKKQYDTGFLVSPVVAEGQLVITDWDGKIFVLSTENGEEIWTRETQSEINGSPAIYKDKVLVASSDAKLYCFRFRDGEPVWTYEADDQIQCSPTIAGDRTFLGGCDGKLHIVDLETGQAAGESLPLEGPSGSTPAVQGDVAVVPTHGGVVFAFDWKKKQQLWRYEDPAQAQEYRNSAAVTESVAIVSSQRKQVDAIDLKTGKQLWRHTLKRFADASPVVAGNDVWIPASDGRLLRLSLADGNLKWSYEVRGSFIGGVAIADDALFVADDDGIVRCFRGL